MEDPGHSVEGSLIHGSREVKVHRQGKAEFSGTTHVRTGDRAHAEHTQCTRREHAEHTEHMQSTWPRNIPCLEGKADENGTELKFPYKEKENLGLTPSIYTGFQTEGTKII